MPAPTRPPRTRPTPTPAPSRRRRSGSGAPARTAARRPRTRPAAQRRRPRRPPVTSAVFSPRKPTVRAERSGNVTVVTVRRAVTHTWPPTWHAYAGGREDEPASLPRPGRGGRGGRGGLRGRQAFRPPRGVRASGRTDRVSPAVEASGAGELAARRPALAAA